MSLRSLLRSVVEWIRPPRRVEPELRITPEQLRAALARMLSDPETRRLVLRDFVGTVFPISGGACVDAKDVNQGNFGTGTACTAGSYAIGLGATDTPGGKLEVQGVVAGGSGLENTHLTRASGNLRVRIGRRGEAADANAILEWDDTNKQLQLFVSGESPGAALNIANGGNVGIGTTGPALPLHAVGGGHVANFDSTYSGAGGAGIFVRQTGASAPANHGRAIFFAFQETGGAVLNTAWVNAVTESAAGAGSVPTALTFYTGSTSSPSERLRITSDGKVGIGTTNPAAQLTLNNVLGVFRMERTGTSNNLRADFMIQTPLGNQQLQIEVTDGAGAARPLVLQPSAGNVGIGTTSPGSILEVSINSLEHARFTRPSGGNLYVRFGNPGTTADANGIVAWDDTLKQLQLFVSGEAAGAALNVANGGNVGIGLTNPSEKLRVAGKVYVEQRLGFVAPGSPDGAAELYREETPPADPSKNIILRSFANKPQTLLALLAPPGNINTSTPINLEATIALSRGDGANTEFLDLYNNGYENPVSGPPNIQYGIRIQRRGTDQFRGKYRDFVFDQDDSLPQGQKFIMVVRATRKIGIGTRDTRAKLMVKGESFVASGKVSVSAGTAVTGNIAALFQQEVDVGDKIRIMTSSGSEERIVTQITSETSLTVDVAFQGSASNVDMTVINKLFRVDDASGNVRFFVSDDGNVGIGTINPASKLDVQGDAILVNSGGKLGFYGTSPVLKPSVSGSRGGNVALANLLSALSQLGLIVDNTTA